MRFHFQVPVVEHCGMCLSTTASALVRRTVPAGTLVNTGCDERAQVCRQGRLPQETEMLVCPDCLEMLTRERLEACVPLT